MDIGGETIVKLNSITAILDAEGLVLSGRKIPAGIKSVVVCDKIYYSAINAKVLRKNVLRRIRNDAKL